MNWTENNIEKAAALYREGLSYSEIAGRIGGSRSAVAGFAQRHRDLFPLRTRDPRADNAARRVENERARQRRFGLSKAQRQRAAALWQNGLTAAAIADALGLARSTIHRLKTENPALFPVRLKPVPEAALEPVEADLPESGDRRQGNFAALQIAGTTPVPLNACGAFRCKLVLTGPDDPAMADPPCCGQPVAEGKSYCAAHLRFLYRQPGESEAA